MGRPDVIQPGLYPGVPGVRSLRVAHEAVPRPKDGCGPNSSVRLVCNGGKESLGSHAATAWQFLRPSGSARHNRAVVDILLFTRRRASGVVVDLVARKPSFGNYVKALSLSG